MSKSEWQSRKYSKQKWKELPDATKRMRYEKSHAWHFTFENHDKEAYAKGYDAIDWSDDGKPDGDK
jgi:hypothetical protein